MDHKESEDGIGDLKLWVDKSKNGKWWFLALETAESMLILSIELRFVF